MIKFFCGWLTFFLISWSIIIPISVYIAGPVEIECWEEKRLGNNGKYQPKTTYVKVCSVGRK